MPYTIHLTSCICQNILYNFESSHNLLHPQHHHQFFAFGSVFCIDQSGARLIAGSSEHTVAPWLNGMLLWVYIIRSVRSSLQRRKVWLAEVVGSICKVENTSESSNVALLLMLNVKTRCLLHITSSVNILFGLICIIWQIGFRTSSRSSPNHGWLCCQNKVPMPVRDDTRRLGGYHIGDVLVATCKPQDYSHPHASQTVAASCLRSNPRYFRQLVVQYYASLTQSYTYFAMYLMSQLNIITVVP